MAFGTYDGVLRGLIHLLKYEGVVTAARPLGESLAKAIGAHLSGVNEQLLLVPVPLHRLRRRHRGFNQAEQIARIAVRRLRARHLQLDTGVLKRTRATDSQTGFTREQRRRNLRGAFAVMDAAKVRGRSVLLVDDVLTTGATAEECARVLRRAGAAAVYVATVARAVSYQEPPQLIRRVGEGIAETEAVSS